MSEPKSNQSTFLRMLCVVACAAAVTFGALWFQERKRNPKEAVTEIEKPVEALKPWQQAATDFNARYQSARLVENPRDALYKLDSVAVLVSVSDDAKKVVSEDSVRTKFELILRKYGVKIDENAVASLEVTITGVWQEEGVRGQVIFPYSATVELFQIVVVDRKGDLRRVVARLWNEGLVAWRAGDRGQVESAILGNVEQLGEKFANAYLAAQAKDKPPPIDFQPEQTP
jgi:hypothetical protein